MAFEFFEDFLIVIGVALIGAVVFSRLKLPSIIAYISAGIIIGPHLLGWVSPHDFSLIGEFGVVFLLFSIGLEFSLPRMLSLKGPVFGLGGAQVVITSIIFGAAVYFWGSSIESAVVVAGALALSSTAIVIRELADLQQFGSRYAQLSVAILLFQDLAAVVFLILVPVMSGDQNSGFAIELASALGRGLVLLVMLMAIGKWVLPIVYHEVARTRSNEVFLLTTLVIALLAAWVTHAFELSMALGGFVIGMMLGEGPYKHQIDTEIRPFKDILLGLFFVTIGMNVDLVVVSEFWFRVVVFAAALIFLSTLIVAVLVRTMGERTDDALRVGLTLAQAGEFGLALLVLAQINGIVPLDQASFIIAIAVLSMLVSPLLIRHSNLISHHTLRIWPDPRSARQNVREPVIQPQRDHVVIGGFGRVGQTVAKLLASNSIPSVGIDNDSETVRAQRLEGANVMFGDCTNPEILERCQVRNARLAILTCRSIDDAKRVIVDVRKLGVVTPIIVRCYENGDFEELISLGTDYVVSEMLESSLLIGAQVLSILDFDPQDINDQLQNLR